MLWGMVIDGVEHAGGLGGDSAPRDLAAALLARIADRDQAAFAELYDLLSPRVFGLILRVLVNRAHAEEVLQEVFLEIWQSAASFAPNRGQGRTWIMTIAHRRAVDRVRSAQAAGGARRAGRSASWHPSPPASRSRSNCASRAGGSQVPWGSCPRRSARR